MELLYADEEVNFVTALVPSDTACLASSPGRIRRTDVWISREERVAFLLNRANLDASIASLSKISLTNELRIEIPRLDMPMLG